MEDYFKKRIDEIEIRATIVGSVHGTISHDRLGNMRFAGEQEMRDLIYLLTETKERIERFNERMK